MLSKKLFQKIVEITENQRVLVYKNQQLIDVLTPGKHKRWDFKNELSFEYFDINTLYFSEQNAERLYRNNPQLNEHIFHCKLSNTEVGLLYVNDLLEGIVAPSEQLYLWQDAGDIRLEKVSIDEEIALDDKTLF